MAEWSGAQGRGRAGGRLRRGSESPDRRLQPAVGPRRASAPVSGSGGAGLSSFRPSRGVIRARGGRPRGPGRGGGLRAVYALLGLSGRPSRRRPAPSSAGRVPICLRAGARPSEPGRHDLPGVRASLCCSFTHVCNLDSHCLGIVGLGDKGTRFVFVSGSARANAFSFFSGTLVPFSGIAPMAFM